MWVMASVLFFAGSAIGALSLLFPHPASFDDTALWVNVAIIGAAGLGALLAAGRLPAWPLHLFILAGVVLISRAIYYSGEASGFYTLFYVWIGLFAFFFFSRRTGILYVAAIGLGYAWVLIAKDASAEMARWFTTIGTVGLAAFLIDSLVRRIRDVAAQSAAIARERAELMATLAEVARTDDLTELPNRRAWDEALGRELARAGREATSLCVGLVDLDRFKRYNDHHGHQAGDRLLRQLAVAWGAELRATDVLTRYGGEEFALALPGCELGDARLLVERLRAATPEDQTCSAGLVRWDGSESAEALFARADRALYEAKEAGRDRIVAA